MLSARANMLPPFICRIIGRKRVTVAGVSRVEPLSNNDIARLADIPRSTVAEISMKLVWDDVPITVADRFAAACGVDLTKPGNHLRWLRKSRVRHLASGNAKQRRFFQRLLTVAK